MENSSLSYFFNKLNSINLSDAQKYQLSKLFDEISSEITTNENDIATLAETKQDNLVDNVNIATINGKSLLTGENIDLVNKELFNVVSSIPVDEPDTNKVYLLKTADSENNLYTEYLYRGDGSSNTINDYEKLGDFRSEIDLADYYNKEQSDTIFETQLSAAAEHLVLQNGIDTNTAKINAITAISSAEVITICQ